MRIIVLGGGAAGVSTALTLKELAPSVEIELWEPNDTLGGMATSAQTPEGEWYNNGVQGIHESFLHTRALLETAGFPSASLTPTRLTSCFVTPTQTWTSGITNMAGQKRNIQCFKRMCSAARQNPRFFALWTIVDACILFAVSRSFVNSVVLPLLALFFGTGNMVAKLPATLAAQVFNVDPKVPNPVTVFDLDPTYFISTRRPNMLALPPMRLVYAALHRELEKRGVVVKLAHKAIRVRETKYGARVTDAHKVSHRADKVVCAMQVPDVIKLLSRRHRALKYFKRTHYFHDVSITHRDVQHMRTHFEYSDTEPVNYFVKERTSRSMDMGFALHRYQRVSPPLFQTLLLQDDAPRTDPLPRADTVLRTDRWYQLGHTVGHFITCVANVHKFQGPHIFFAGSWTLVNSHEVAVMSGILAAQLILGTSAFPSHTFGAASQSYVAYKNALKM